MVRRQPVLVEHSPVRLPEWHARRSRKYLRREPWLPPSNVYFHNVARAFFGYVITHLEPKATTAVLTHLTNSDNDTIWKLFFFATHTTRNTRLPTTHKLSFLPLLAKRHNELGKPLSKTNWQLVSKSRQLDFEKYGLFRLTRTTQSDISALQYVPDGTVYTFPHALPGRLKLESNWSLTDARLVDPNDEEDLARLVRRFSGLKKDWSFTKEEITEAEKNNADDVRPPKDEPDEDQEDDEGANGDVSGESAADGEMAKPVWPPPAKKAKPNDKEPPAPTKIPKAPQITPIKATRRPRGAVKQE